MKASRDTTLVRRLPRRVTDRLVAAGLLAWAAPDVPWWWRPAGHGAATPVVLGYMALVLVQSVPFLWWRRVPLLVAGLAAAVLAIRTGLGQDPYSASAATAVGAFGLGAWGGPRTRLAARILTAAAAAAAAIVLLTSHGFRQEALPLALLATALGLGEVTAANRDAAAASARLTHDAERSRFARELHDVLSHQLSAIAVQAGAARLASQKDPGVAVRTVGGIEDIARQGLIELNRIVGALRRDPREQLDRRPLPRLDDLPDLIDGARSAGLPVCLAIAGPHRSMSATVELAAYRVVQESLTNALRYARSAPVSVALSYLDGGLDLLVENDAPAVPAAGREAHAAGEQPVSGGTRGLKGLAERAQLLGGSLQAGPRPDGGFSVHAWLPASQ
ncbi:MAG: sensor histidine kinase [Streptosporangiaceae bacterium]